jgi:adenylate kinase
MDATRDNPVHMTSHNLVLLGPPGSGKGTQAERLRDELGLTHISTGDLVRAHPEETEEYSRAGRLVPDDVVVGLLAGALREAPGGALLDGFPRSVEQAGALDALLREEGRPLTGVLFLDVPDDVVAERLAQRGREDDTAETVKERLAVYRESTEPLVEYYERRGLLRRIDGARDADAVQGEIRAALPA